MSNFWVLFCTLVCLMGCRVFGNVVLICNNVTLSSFDDVEANFAPPVKGSGKSGRLYVAEPLDACSPLNNTVNSLDNEIPSPFLLIIRGGCSFEEKVRRAQSAGFKAAIVFDNEDGQLVAMSGTSAGIKINAVFISKASGLLLKQYDGSNDMELWIIPSFSNSAWSIMAISFISLLAMSAVLATCFFVRRHRIRRERPRTSRVREFHGMSSRLVKAMPSLIFTAVLEDNSTSSTCAICLEDYSIGERLRILPCRHKFHATCVDAWLTSWRTFCPVCKRDARTNTIDLPASERTPLLSTPASVTSSMLSSVRSSYASSTAIQIGQSSSARSPFVSNNNSISTSYNNNQQSLQSYIIQSPYLISPSRSSLDLRNAASSSSQRSRGPHLVSSNSLGYPCLLSPNNSRYMMSPYIQSSYNGSVSNYVGSSSHRPSMLRHSESTQSFSRYDSVQSLPDC